MKKTNVFWILAVVMTALFLAGCRKETFVENSHLYLKSAVTANEMVSVQYLKDGTFESFDYPDNILFKISGSKAEMLTKMLLVEIKYFDLLDEGRQAMFLISAIRLKPIVIISVGEPTLYDINMASVYADKLPFSITDFGLQSATGDARFSGLLKAENFIFAVKDGQIMIYDLNSNSDKIITVKSSIQNDVLTFKVNSETWVLKFIRISPVGNVFEFSGGGKTSTCYTLS